jgi:hypothetical protein
LLEQQLLLLDESRVEHADGRSPVARDEHAGLQAAARVRADLVERQAHQRVDAAEVNERPLPGESARDVLLWMPCLASRFALPPLSHATYYMPVQARIAVTACRNGDERTRYHDASA